MHNLVILENIRSAYNVGNIVRTADSLGREVWIVGYTPSPLTHPKVLKTSLWAEKNIGLQQFNFSEDAIKKAKELGYRKMYLETHTNLAAAIHIYEKSGYREIEKPAEVVHSTMNRFYLKDL